VQAMVVAGPQPEPDALPNSALPKLPAKSVPMPLALVGVARNTKSAACLKSKAHDRGMGNFASRRKEVFAK